MPSRKRPVAPSPGTKTVLESSNRPYYCYYYRFRSPGIFISDWFVGEGKIWSMTVPEPGLTKSVVETQLKPFSLVFNPIAERIGNRFKRKPKLYVHIHPATCLWCYAWQMPNPNPTMQVGFDADFTNDSDHDALLLLDAYVEGTRSQLPFMSVIKVPSTSTNLRETVGVHCTPVVGEGGNDFTGRIIFVDQLKRKHKSDKTTFTGKERRNRRRSANGSTRRTHCGPAFSRQ
jgi:hypothetical protein